MKVATHVSQTNRPRGIPRVIGVISAVLTFAFVGVSSTIALRPEFQFESQFPALLPFFIWSAAAGVGHLANVARRIVGPWRASWGPASLAPYGLLMLTKAAAPHLVLPWWLALVAAGVAAVPFLVASLRTPHAVAFRPSRAVTAASVRGTFLVAVSLMVMAYSVAGPVIAGAALSVLLTVALALTGLAPHGLAHASVTWRLRHWVALSWGSLVIWGSVLLHALTTVFAPWWAVFAAVVLAGVPLVLVSRTDVPAVSGA